MKRSAEISSILKPLDVSASQAYISNALQVADILEWILNQQDGAASCTRRDITVRQSTFSISEEFLRRMFFIKRRLSSVRFIVVIDRKALLKTMQLWNFVANVYDEVYISDNHSKILLVSSDSDPSGGVAMVTSQNLTRGNRAESSVISSDPDVFFSLLADFNDLITNNSAPMHEIMPTAAGQDSESGTRDLCAEIERLAGYFVPVSDIAVVLDIPPALLRDRLADPESPEALAYRRGKAKAKIALKAQEMELAKVGSPLGLQSVRENLLAMEHDED